MGKTGNTPVYYHGAPDACDMCKQGFGNTMYDCSIPTAGGSWGNVCVSCFRRNYCSIGTGRGQQYAKQLDGRWLKIGG